MRTSCAVSGSELGADGQHRIPVAEAFKCKEDMHPAVVNPEVDEQLGGKDPLDDINPLNNPGSLVKQKKVEHADEPDGTEEPPEKKLKSE